MCSNYEAVTRDDRLLAFFGAARPEGRRNEPEVWPLGIAPFIRRHEGGSGNRVIEDGRFGLLPHFAKELAFGRRTYNARSETVDSRPTYRTAWRAGQRCLIPAAWYQEPNWETGKNIWWRLRRADGEPWALAGIWSEWTDPESGEIVPSYTMLTINCDGHPLLGRLHKPDPKLPPDAQDKRSVVPLAPDDWAAWLHGDEAGARRLLAVPPASLYDPADAQRTDAALTLSAASPPDLFAT